MRKLKRRLSILFLAASLLCEYPPAAAQGPCKQWVAEVVSVQGMVEVRKASDRSWRPVRLKDTFCPGDMLRVRERSRAAVRLSTQAILRLDQDTTVTFNGVERERTSLLDLIKGAVYFFTRTPRGLKVAMPFVNGGVEGTEFYVRVEADRTYMAVFEGRVSAANARGGIVLASGQSALTRADQPPVARVEVHPRDAVRWALYYPPIGDYRTDDFSTDGWQGEVRRSLESLAAGDLTGALAILETAPKDVRDPRFYTFRAGLLLQVGRVDEALPDLETALSLDPANSRATALQSILALTRNEKKTALKLAEQAVSQDPGSPAGHIALSYARQARFDLDGALESLRLAVERTPENALAWARLAELRLSLGELDRALKAARQAAELNPDLERTQTVLGFAYLTQIRTGEARQAFTRAIALDSAAPLPRLGLGLAIIRDGDLPEGRAQIEIAAGLDPDNALIRSYLGKAYFEEKRDTIAERQYALAKQLDPLDPTPWFYDAIRKQTVNRPVEALHDLQKSIELNDNRAVFRSRLMLDEDLAARSASLGRIYRDLGFEQLALVEGWKSVNGDPANYSAHRLLAETYAARPRHEIARVSELLQAQLLQPINITPVQPQLAESSQLILEGAGPADPGFNEFTSLFNRNRLALQGSGVVGSNRTFGDELIFSGLQGKVSYSLGQFHYETEGFRENNDLQQNTYNAFVQASVTHRTGVQAEVRTTNWKQGQLDLLFDPNISADFRENRKADLARFGFRHRFSTGSTVIGSLIYQDIDIDQTQTRTNPFPVKIDTDRTREGFQAELQHLFRKGRLNLTSGVGYIDQDFSTRFAGESLLPIPLPPLPFKPNEGTLQRTNIYTYAQLELCDTLDATLGLSGDFLEMANQINSDQLNPKFGLTWRPSPRTTLRGAVFRERGIRLDSNQTIEPTQVAGFNQFFDDINGTDSWRYGAAVDHRFSTEVFGGIEYIQRDLEVPLLGDPETPASFFDWREQLSRAYLYWTPNPRCAFDVEYQFERFDREDNPMQRGVVDVKTHRVPLSVGFFHPSGLSARLKGTYVHQSGDFNRRDSDQMFPGEEDFWLLDASLSCRLPKRCGLISVGVKNLFDTNFNYQDTDPENPLYIPDRYFFARLTLSF